MKQLTYIYERKRQFLIYSDYLPIEKAILLARENGVKGRLEVQHRLRDKEKEILYSLYFINTENKIVGCVFPFLHTTYHLTFEKAITTKTEKKPNNVIDFVRLDRKRNYTAYCKALRCPNVIGD